MHTTTTSVSVGPRVVGETLAVVYAAGAVAGLLVALGSDLDAVGRAVSAAAVVAGLVVAGSLLIRVAPLPRGVPDVLLGLSSVLVGVAVPAAAQASSGVALAYLSTVVVVLACYCFPLRTAVLHVVVAWLLVNGALLVRGDVHLFSVLALDAILLALAVVSRRLALRASGALTDPLTGLPNRRAFDDLLQHLVSSDRTLSVALLDLDHFKEINDVAGHEAGDRVLLQVAERAARVLPPDAVLARQGGDEFAVLLPGSSGADAAVHVRRVCDALAPTGLSCGVAEYEPGETAAQLVRRADGALYAAKAAGRGRVELAGSTSGSRR